METKKSKKADLEKKRFIFLQIGFVLVLSVVLFAFELKIMPGKNLLITDNFNYQMDDEIIPITTPEEKVKLKPQPPEILDIVPDKEEIKNEVEIESTEASDTMKIEIPELTPEPEDETPVNFYSIEKRPTFGNGDENAANVWLAKNTKFPPAAREMGITGRVWVSFIIDKNGKVTQIELAKGVDPMLDKEALRVVNSMPNWTPGSQRGKPVNVSFQVPINFVLY